MSLSKPSETTAAAAQRLSISLSPGSFDRVELLHQSKGMSQPYQKDVIPSYQLVENTMFHVLVHKQIASLTNIIQPVLLLLQETNQSCRIQTHARMTTHWRYSTSCSSSLESVMTVDWRVHLLVVWLQSVSEQVRAGEKTVALTCCWRLSLGCSCVHEWNQNKCTYLSSCSRVGLRDHMCTLSALQVSHWRCSKLPCMYATLCCVKRFSCHSFTVHAHCNRRLGWNVTTLWVLQRHLHFLQQHDSSKKLCTHMVERSDDDVISR